jgi:hypothetical protein
LIFGPHLVSAPVTYDVRRQEARATVDMNGSRQWIEGDFLDALSSSLLATPLVTVAQTAGTVESDLLIYMLSRAGSNWRSI